MIAQWRVYVIVVMPLTQYSAPRRRKPLKTAARGLVQQILSATGRGHCSGFFCRFLRLLRERAAQKRPRPLGASMLLAEHPRESQRIEDLGPDGHTDANHVST
jgi:hypothetical protein